MNVFIVYAHPEPRSLNGSIKNFMVERLERAGHTVRVSDLYAMRWKPQLDGADFPARVVTERLSLEAASQHAFATDTQTADVRAEQDKLRWADVVLFQFPLWWYSMPAILKGWVERVYAYGFAYGVGKHSETRWGDRFGEGVMAGKRAMLVITAGGWESHYAPRGINGAIDELLFPITHGVLYYPGFDVLPSFVVYRTGKVDFERVTRRLGERLDTLATTPPIPFRPQNAGDYEIPSMTLRPEHAPGEVGLRIHQRRG